jgi:hypothetical protein
MDAYIVDGCGAAPRQSNELIPGGAKRKTIEITQVQIENMDF